MRKCWNVCRVNLYGIEAKCRPNDEIHQKTSLNSLEFSCFACLLKFYTNYSTSERMTKGVYTLTVTLQESFTSNFSSVNCLILGINLSEIKLFTLSNLQKHRKLSKRSNTHRRCNNSRWFLTKLKDNIFESSYQNFNGRFETRLQSSSLFI